MTRKAWILALGILVPPISCAPEAEVDYFPLRNGATWEYDFSVAIPGIGQQEGKAIMRVDRKEKIGDEWYSRVTTEYQGFDMMEDQVSYYRRGEEGIYQISRAAPEAEPKLTLVLPPRVGTEWTVEREHGQAQYAYESTEDVEIRGRTYPNCFKIRVTDFQGKEPASGYEYIAPDVGVVKRLLLLPRATLEMNLVKFVP